MFEALPEKERHEAVRRVYGETVGADCSGLKIVEYESQSIENLASRNVPTDHSVGFWQIPTKSRVLLNFLSVSHARITPQVS